MALTINNAEVVRKYIEKGVFYRYSGIDGTRTIPDRSDREVTVYQYPDGHQIRVANLRAY
jgi:hypothetical protein